MKAYYLKTYLILATLATALAGFGCSPRQQGASLHGFYASGRANFNISVSQPLSLAHSGFLTAEVPADVRMYPSGSFRYALFSDSGKETISRQAHIILSELPNSEWRWEMETWARPEALSYAKDRIAGKYWTIQMLPVSSATDWFSELWMKNGSSVPDFWLAKRWSSTPEDNIRIVAEYREPAPLCMQKHLQNNAQQPDQVFPVTGKQLWRGCEQEIEEFSSRADKAFTFDRGRDFPEKAEAKPTSLPAKAPNMGHLVGRAENIDRDTPSYKD